MARRRARCSSEHRGDALTAASSGSTATATSTATASRSTGRVRPQGYENMGWKDAGDAVVYPDGRQVKQPKALCELQGYVFDARMRMAEVFDALGEPERARRAARARRRRSGRRFEERSGARSSASTPSRSIPTSSRSARSPPTPATASGAGIAEPGPRRAGRQRASSSPTCGAAGASGRCRHSNPAYNPFSYQRGSVWPHDNGIIALGFKRYGFAAEAARIARDISEAASYFVELPAAGALRGHRAPAPTPSRSTTAAPTCPRPGPPGASSTCSRRCSASGPTRRAADSTSIPSFRTGSRRSRSTGWRWAGRESTCASGATAIGAGGRRRYGKARFPCRRRRGVHGASTRREDWLMSQMPSDLFRPIHERAG